MAKPNNDPQIAELEAKQAQIENNIGQLISSLSPVNESIKILRKDLKRVKNKLKELKAKDIVFTDKAIMKYMELVLKEDFDKIASDAVDKDILEAMNIGGDGLYLDTTGDTVLVLKGNNIVDVRENVGKVSKLKKLDDK